MASAHARNQYQQQAQQTWVDRCRVVADEQGLHAVPYLEAARFADYELGATLAAIAANRLIRTLIARASQHPSASQP